MSLLLCFGCSRCSVCEKAGPVVRPFSLLRWECTAGRWQFASCTFAPVCCLCCQLYSSGRRTRGTPTADRVHEKRITKPAGQGIFEQQAAQQSPRISARPEFAPRGTPRGNSFPRSDSFRTAPNSPAHRTQQPKTGAHSLRIWLLPSVAGEGESALGPFALRLLICIPAVATRSCDRAAVAIEELTPPTSGCKWIKCSRAGAR
jgi:hypothetical protein